MNKIFLASIIIIVNCLCSYSQEFSNESYQKIIIIDGENEGDLEIFADPISFDCECDNVITVIVKKSSKPNIFISDDNIVTLEIQGEEYIISLSKKTECCFIKPGLYTSEPSKWD